MDLKPCRVVWIEARRWEKRLVFRSHRNPVCSVSHKHCPSYVLALLWVRWIQTPFLSFFLVLPRKGCPAVRSLLRDSRSPRTCQWPFRSTQPCLPSAHKQQVFCSLSCGAQIPLPIPFPFSGLTYYSSCQSMEQPQKWISSVTWHSFNYTTGAIRKAAKHSSLKILNLHLRHFVWLRAEVAGHELSKHTKELNQCPVDTVQQNKLMMDRTAGFRVWGKDLQWYQRNYFSPVVTIPTRFLIIFYWSCPKYMWLEEMMHKLLTS